MTPQAPKPAEPMSQEQAAREFLKNPSERICGFGFFVDNRRPLTEADFTLHRDEDFGFAPQPDGKK